MTYQNLLTLVVHQYIFSLMNTYILAPTWDECSVILSRHLPLVSVEAILTIAGNVDDLITIANEYGINIYELM